MSVVRRAHLDISNEVAFVALAQSRGRAAEAAAVLHLPGAKDEAALVTAMLDVTSFIVLTRDVAERRRQSRQLEKQHRQPLNRIRNKTASHAHRHQQLQHDRQHSHGAHQTRQQKQWDQRVGQQRCREGPFFPHEDGVSGDPDGGAGGRGEDNATGQVDREVNREQLWQLQRENSASGGDGSRGELQSRGSGSAPALLPPLKGLTDGTPPTPNTLKTVLLTSSSVAPRIPKVFGLATEAAMTGRNGAKTTKRYVIVFHAELSCVVDLTLTILGDH